MQIELTPDGKRLYLKFMYTPERVQTIRKIPNIVFDKKAKVWHFPLSVRAVAVVKWLEERGYSASEQVHQALKRFQAFALERADFTTKLPLYPFQQKIARFMYKAGTSANGSYCASGKTITTLGVIDGYSHHNPNIRILVICPAAIQLQLSKNIKHWLPEALVYTAGTYSSEERSELYRSLQSNVPDGLEFVVMGYERARIDSNILCSIPFHIGWLDEVHRIANPESLTHQKISLLNCGIWLGTSATLLKNDLFDLWGVMTFLKGGVMPNRWKFEQDYCVKNDTGAVVGFKNVKPFVKAVSPYLIRISLEESKMELPEVTHTDLTFALSEEERKVYDQIKHGLIRELYMDEGNYLSKVDKPLNLQLSTVKLGKLQELTNSMEMLGEGTKSSKIELLKEHLEGMLNSTNNSILVYSRFTRTLDILERELAEYNPLKITGQVSAKQKDNAVRSFNNGVSRVMLLSDAGGEGWELQKANVLYMMDTPYSLRGRDQIHGRIRRKSDEMKPCWIYNLIAEKTIDQYVQKKLTKKQTLHDEVFATLEDIRELLTKNI